MRITKEQLKQIIKEELEDMMGKPEEHPHFRKLNWYTSQTALCDYTSARWIWGESMYGPTQQAYDDVCRQVWKRDNPMIKKLTAIKKAIQAIQNAEIGQEIKSEKARGELFSVLISVRNHFNET